MNKPRKAVVSKKRVVHTYAELWHASGCVLAAGLRDERGSSWQFLSSIVLTAFAFEAYLNHVGSSVLRTWDELERLPPLAKFNLLCELLGVTFPKGKSSRPLQTVIELLAFRSAIAHGRSETLAPAPVLRDVNEKLGEFLGQRPMTRWECLIQSGSFAERAREDLEHVLKKLHARRKEPKEALFMFGLGFHSARHQKEP